MMPFPTAAPTATIDPSAAKLELLSTTESRSVALATVEGSVRNLSNGSFENVQVVVQYYSSDDRPVTRGTAALASTLLGPGQTSYFKCLVPIEPGMARFTISFVDQAGQPIPSVDRR